MDELDTASADVLRFPPRLRTVPALEAAISTDQVRPVLVDHAGRTYRLADLLTRMTKTDLREVETTAPRTAQAEWDEVVRRWPTLADLIVAGASACPAPSPPSLSPPPT